jgi:CubicO group peptidase (beta-lactamase class C family)
MKHTFFLFFYLFAVIIGPRASGQQAGLTPSLADKLQHFVDRTELAGAVALVVDIEGTRSVDSVGFANIEQKVVMDPKAMFWIASQSKPITAVAVMMLVDEGKIVLDDPVEKYLPEFRGQMVIAEKDEEHVLLKKPDHPITVREVLSHMSGLPFKSALEQPTLDLLPLAVAVRSYAAAPLNTEPGTTYQYANAGINTAARILEVVSGLPYETFLQQRLFDPLGMSDTTFWPNEEQQKRMADVYRPGKDGKGLEVTRVGQLLYPLHDRTRRFPMPGGGLFSTAHDTGQFCRMMLNGGKLDGRRYISEAAWSELTTRQTPDTVKQSYGLGFSLGGDSFGHGGAQATNMTIYPERGMALVWMVQHAGFPGEGKKAQHVFKEWALEQAVVR